MNTKSSRMSFRSILALSITASLCTGLVACGGKPGAATSASGTSSQTSAEQQQIAKYNTYVDAANQIDTSFSQELREHLRLYGDRLKGGGKLDMYSVPMTMLIERLDKELKQGLAMAPAMDDLDPAAKQFADALDALVPLNRELESYADSKGYLADDGAKARAQDPAYVAALTAVARAEGAFMAGIAARDEKNIRDAFEQAEQGSQAYYRAGMILYSHQSMDAGDAFFESLGSAETADTFKTSLDKVGEMSEAWDKKVRETIPAGCRSVTRQANLMLGNARDALKHAADGAYKRYDLNDPISKMMSPVVNDASHFRRNYNDLVAQLNSQRC
ncbi:DUF3829 domain-containing protein [Pseudoxanthomonas sp.]|uniref:DUF3829 domain-containing protein n=1 Tax=Pseudoxanthomonas sp. TaxID=1871049 RepID=UPI00261E537C|nr:DUF3829 domain-containing protein [Pseudoxanthomonas sp.]WDS37457.1 MAG: DUF3829 domain-containing protein [Pseudoxanthomonas sp.]